MRKLNAKWVWLGLVLVAGMLSFSSAAQATKTQTEVQTTTSANATGIVCTSDASPNPTFTLTTKTGYINLPDGNTMFMWGYSEGSSPFQHPGPVLCVNQGDTVTIILQNTLNEAASVMFPGQENVLANGVPAEPQFDGGGALTSLTNVAAANGGSMTYSFVATEPGTYLYESGTNPVKQVGMGLFGALIVRPSSVPVGGTDPNPAHYAYNRSDSVFTASEEFMVLLSEIDPYQHQAAENGLPYNLNNYKARYWLINGRGFPDSIADNYTSWLPTQPYGALARIHEFNDTLPPSDPNYHPYPGMIRYLNVGTEEYPFHPHGNNGLVIGRDGRSLEGTAGEDLSFEKFAINIGPGQTWDVIFKWYDAEQYDETTNPVPVTVPQIPNMVYGQFYSGGPYLGVPGTIPTGGEGLNQCGEYYIISHNHALYQITSWGVNMTGPITYLRIDPPEPNNCP
ncbi:MAG: multicopper oxidase domain-containing protein [Anaerolineales bacterium]|nr:multicopper oxidase domain-containing protein [Anaerolineales bacterium]MCB8936925.1 multicopper oxidase domain-containing protein [Ardenticatenaceae bacterium]